jgi:hypothetical protein
MERRSEFCVLYYGMHAIHSSVTFMRQFSVKFILMLTCFYGNFTLLCAVFQNSCCYNGN